MTRVSTFTRFEPRTTQEWMPLNPWTPATLTIESASAEARTRLRRLFDEGNIGLGPVYRIELFNQPFTKTKGAYGACVYTLKCEQLPYLYLPFARFDQSLDNCELLRGLLMYCGMVPGEIESLRRELQRSSTYGCVIVTREQEERFVGKVRLSRHELRSTWRVIHASPPR